MRAKSLIAILFLGFLMAGTAQPLLADRGPAGRYRLTGEPDSAATLRLDRDGRFRYDLSSGALDERAEGRWRHDGANLRLTTEPTPIPPVFSAEPPAHDNDTPLHVQVNWPGGRGMAGVDFRIGFDSGDPVEGYTQEYGWSLPPDDHRAPRWIVLAIPMYGLVSPRFPIDLTKGNALRFTLIPNNFGIVDFRDALVEVQGKTLILHRSTGELHFIRSH